MACGKSSGRSIRSVSSQGPSFVVGSHVSLPAGTDFYSDVAFVLTIVFVAIANVLLLNVLVALFK